jgi:uncharacterized membrane protein
MASGFRLSRQWKAVALLGIAVLAPTGTLHALIYGMLLVVFARSLRPGGEALVTQIARRMRGGTLPDDLSVYTRRVTWAWALFCAVQLAISAALRVLAPRADWAIFVNLANLPLLAIMVAGEYAYRRWHFRHHPHVSLAAMLSAMRRPVWEWWR